MLSWNILGILLWVIIILYLVFIIQNIRQRRIKMIIKQHKRFSWASFSLSAIEVLIFLGAAGWLLSQNLFDNPNLEDQSRIRSTISYQPLIMMTGTVKSHYVTISSPTRKLGDQTYTFYRAGKKETVSSQNSSVSYGKTSMDVFSEKIPYNKKMLDKMDRQYQRAYVAVYTAKYKKNWQNGIGLHAGHVALKYYLIRIPDASFIKQVK